MKFRLSAGADIEMVTPGELHEALRGAMQSWQVELSKGIRPVRFTGQGTIASGSIKIGGDSVSEDRGRLGPEPGFLWDVRRLAIRGINPSSESVSLYVNTESPVSLVKDSITAYASFIIGELVIQGPEQLMIVGNNLASTGDVLVSGGALAIPIGLSWRLL